MNTKVELSGPWNAGTYKESLLPGMWILKMNSCQICDLVSKYVYRMNNMRIISRTPKSKIILTLRMGNHAIFIEQNLVSLCGWGSFGWVMCPTRNHTQPQIVRNAMLAAGSCNESPRNRARSTRGSFPCKNLRKPVSCNRALEWMDHAHREKFDGTYMPTDLSNGENVACFSEAKWWVCQVTLLTEFENLRGHVVCGSLYKSSHSCHWRVSEVWEAKVD